MSRATRAHVAEAVKDAPDRIAAERIGLTAFIAFVRQHRELYRIIEEAKFIAEDVYREHYRTFVEGYRRNLAAAASRGERSEEHTSELQSLMPTPYAVFCLKNKN